MQITKHSNGIVEFKNVIDIDQQILFSYMNYLSEINESSYKYFEENGKKYTLNKSGFKFNVEDIIQAPSRFVQLEDVNVKEEYKNLLNLIQSGLAQCLNLYFGIYPDARTTVWWKTNGHIAGYTEGQWIGPHCDDQIGHTKNNPNINQIPMHNTISCGLYLNDSVSSEDQMTDYTYMGGEMFFPHSDLTYTPSSGGVIMYPSNYIGRHQVNPVTMGRRYVFLQFYGYGIPENTNKDSLDWITF